LILSSEDCDERQDGINFNATNISKYSDFAPYEKTLADYSEIIDNNRPKSCISNVSFNDPSQKILRKSSQVT
jgi:hypothetical protein